MFVEHLNDRPQSSNKERVIRRSLQAGLISIVIINIICFHKGKKPKKKKKKKMSNFVLIEGSSLTCFVCTMHHTWIKVSDCCRNFFFLATHSTCLHGTVKTKDTPVTRDSCYFFVCIWIKSTRSYASLL